MRSGTENLYGIVGFDKAIELAAVPEDTYITLRSILNNSESISFACIVILSEPYAGEEFKFISSKYLIISGKIDDWLSDWKFIILN